MSDITKETLQWAVENADAPIVAENDRKWLKRGFEEIQPLKASAVKLHTLTSLVEFVRMDEERDDDWIHIVSPTMVEYLGVLDARRGREIYAIAEPMIDSEFPVGQWMSQDVFVTNVQTHFADNDDREKLLKVVGNLASRWNQTMQDDGITQKVETLTGIVSKAQEKLPNPVTLHPYETFAEIELYPRDYIVRLAGDADSKPKIALFAIPDPRRSHELCGEIKTWLIKALPPKYEELVLG